MAGKSKAELRRFGLTVGGALLVLGVLSAWRHHTLAPRVMWALGGALLVSGLVAPALLAPVERFWMGPVVRVASRVGDVVSRVFLAVLYYLVFAPIGVVLRRVHDPLDRRLDDARPSQWVKRTVAPVDPARYEQLF
jgi:hypothetical protein